MNQQKRKLLSVLLRLAAVALLVFVLCFYNTQAFEIFARVALLSAKSYLPTSGFALFEGSDSPSESEKASVNTAEMLTTAEPVTTVKAQNLAVIKNKSDLTATDADISALIENAKKQSVNDKKDGDIYEYTFTDDGVTDSFGVVKVKNVNETQIDIEKKLSEKLELTANKEDPVVLIYHTHTTETYQLLDRNFYAEGFLSRSNDENVNMIRVGKAVSQELERLGYKVIHDTGVYDNPYTGAYYRSMDAAEAYLEKYPSIQITIDLHRDAIQDDNGVKTKPTAVINGKKAAQIMIITGCQEEGNGITDLPEWDKNLTFALKLQQSMETLFPGLTRPVYFCPRSYNMGLTPMSLLIEMGTDANTVDEAVYSGKMLGRALGEVISSQVSPAGF